MHTYVFSALFLLTTIINGSQPENLPVQLTENYVVATAPQAQESTPPSLDSLSVLCDYQLKQELSKLTDQQLAAIKNQLCTPISNSHDNFRKIFSWQDQKESPFNPGFSTLNPIQQKNSFSRHIKKTNQSEQARDAWKLNQRVLSAVLTALFHKENPIKLPKTTIDTPKSITPCFPSLSTTLSQQPQPRTDHLTEKELDELRADTPVQQPIPETSMFTPSDNDDRNISSDFPVDRTSTPHFQRPDSSEL
jgi:hypothetical protein